MKKYFCVIFAFFILTIILYSNKVNAILPLSGKIIVIDPGHGGSDPGTSYNNILEKNINLEISKKLYEELIRNGATVILTREGDYDLAKPNANRRKKSDFDNRIKLINESNANLYISIHLNYLNDSYYSGPQVFYYGDNLELASNIQESMNDFTKENREVKVIPDNTYMYDKINVKGVLIECGFISNQKERSKLITSSYQESLAKSIVKGIIKYF